MSNPPVSVPPFFNPSTVPDPGAPGGRKGSLSRHGSAQSRSRQASESAEIPGGYYNLARQTQAQPPLQPMVQPPLQPPGQPPLQPSGQPPLQPSGQPPPPAAPDQSEVPAKQKSQALEKPKAQANGGAPKKSW